ncbi:glycosyl hydrolase-like protein, partial [human gut metagenome]
SSFSEEPSAGEAAFTLSPRQFLDVNGQPATPDKGFKLTCEMLRRKPDSALVWYEDFRDDTPLPDSYWTTLSGEWSVWRESYTTENRPYSLLEGSGKLAWKYEGFSDLHIRLDFLGAGDGGLHPAIVQEIGDLLTEHRHTLIGSLTELTSSGHSGFPPCKDKLSAVVLRVGVGCRS